MVVENKVTCCYYKYALCFLCHFISNLKRGLKRGLKLSNHMQKSPLQEPKVKL